MKKGFSIILLAVFLFNVVGYYGIYLTMLRKAHLAVNEQIDNNQFSEDQTITLKIPISLPYTISDNNYERVHGDFELRGEFYKLVKQKYQNDTLFIVCLKNVEKKKAFKVFSDLIKISTDQHSTSNSNLKSVINFIKDYSPTSNAFELKPFHSYDKKVFHLLTFSIHCNNLPIFGPPPEAVI